METIFNLGWSERVMEPSLIKVANFNARLNIQLFFIYVIFLPSMSPDKKIVSQELIEQQSKVCKEGKITCASFLILWPRHAIAMS